MGSWQVRGQRIGQRPDMAGIGEVVRIDEQVQLTISFEALGGVDAGEREVFVKQHLFVIIIRLILPSAFGEGFCNLCSTQHISILAFRREGQFAYLVKSFPLHPGVPPLQTDMALCKSGFSSQNTRHRSEVY